MARNHEPSIWRMPSANVTGATTAAEVMQRGHDLAFTVERRPIAFADTGEVIPDAFALARGDNGRKLAIVGKSYRELQNAAALDPFDALVEKGVIAYQSAGSTDGGSRVWIRATLPGIGVKAIGDARVGDTVAAHVVLSHGHGGAGITITAVIEALTCLNGARRVDAGNVRRMRHTGDVGERVRAAVIQTEIVQREIDRLAAIGSMLTTRGPKDHDAVLDYLAAVYQEDAGDLASTRKAQAIGRLFVKGEMIGADLPTRHGTWWGLYNALTEYLTHEHGRTAESRAEAFVWGESGGLANRGLDVAAAMGWSDLTAAQVLDLSDRQAASVADSAVMRA